MKHFLFLIGLMFITHVDLFAANHTVKMLNQGAAGVMIFEPAFLKINTGDSVTFQATDAAHNSASIPGMIPSGGPSWNSALSKDLNALMLQEDDIEKMEAADAIEKKIIETSRSGTR